MPTLSAPVLLKAISEAKPTLMVDREDTAECRLIPAPAAVVRALPVMSPLPVMAPPTLDSPSGPGTVSAESSVMAPEPVLASCKALLASSPDVLRSSAPAIVMAPVPLVMVSWVPGVIVLSSSVFKPNVVLPLSVAPVPREMAVVSV